MKLALIRAITRTSFGSNINNQERLNNSARKSSESYCTRRKCIRGAKKSKSDDIKDKEGKTYDPGQFI